MVKYEDIKDLTGLDFWKSIADELDYPPECYCTEDWCVEFEKENFKAREEMRNTKENLLLEALQRKENIDKLPQLETTSECINDFLLNFFENNIIDESLLIPTEKMQIKN